MPGEPLQSDDFFHASAVAAAGRGLLILGPSGAGKSALALELVARGARLVGDDRLRLSREAEGLIARGRPGFEGQIEARGVGILRVPAEPEARIRLVVDMGREERDRLPPPREIILFGCRLPLLLHAAAPHFPAAILLKLAEDNPNV